MLPSDSDQHAEFAVTCNSVQRQVKMCILMVIHQSLMEFCGFDLCFSVKILRCLHKGLLAECDALFMPADGWWKFLYKACVHMNLFGWH